MILDNLISNAMKYTEAGEISVGVSQVAKDGHDWVKIEVKDTGYGISKEALPHIFERYYQEKSEYQASGTGIGLALVKSLVALHHGVISVSSQLGKGTNFEILLPCDDKYPEAMHTEIKLEEENQSEFEAGGVGREDSGIEDHILIVVVDDNADILDYVEKSLSGIFDVKTASNGKEGLELARKYMPDVIVTDLMMPIMNGIEMCRHLKDDMTTSHIPVIMLTAKDSLEDREEGYSVGADSYLTKPFNANLLITRINNIISRRILFAEHLKNNMQISGIKSDSEDLLIEKDKYRTSISELDRQFLSKLDAIILASENAGKINIEMLTDRMFMSKATLYRKMKALTGLSANEYIRQIRVEQAKEYILEGKMTMGEISDILGFSSQSYFRESFKAVCGMTPSEYVKSLKCTN